MKQLFMLLAFVITFASAARTIQSGEIEKAPTVQVCDDVSYSVIDAVISESEVPAELRYEPVPSRRLQPPTSIIQVNLLEGYNVGFARPPDSGRSYG